MIIDDAVNSAQVLVIEDVSRSSIVSPYRLSPNQLEGLTSPNYIDRGILGDFEFDLNSRGYWIERNGDYSGLYTRCPLTDNMQCGLGEIDSSDRRLGIPGERGSDGAGFVIRRSFN